MEDTEQQLSVEAVTRRVRDVRERIHRACARAERKNNVTVVGVSKTFPLQAVEAGVSAGLDHFGENRARQLRDKAEERPGLFNGGDISWHMVGHLQRNKAKFVARHADWFDALDSPRLAKELNKRAAKNDRVLPCLVQVNISRADQKYGLDPEETHDYLDHCAAYDNLAIRGLMGMASFVEDPEEVRGQFQEIRHLFESYDATGHPTVEMEELSTGMSNDFEVAVEEGSTMVRLGTAVFGAREYE